MEYIKFSANLSVVPRIYIFQDREVARGLIWRLLADVRTIQGHTNHQHKRFRFNYSVFVSPAEQAQVIPIITAERYSPK